MINLQKSYFSHARPRLIATLLLRNSLAFVSNQFNSYEYVGDPIVILNILSGFMVDEVIVIDLDASSSGALNKRLLQSLRSIADYPLSYAGGLRDQNNIDSIFQLGYDKIFLSLFNPSLNNLASYASAKSGIQSIALSIDYTLTINSERFLFNPYDRLTKGYLNDFPSIARLDYFSDILLTNTTLTGTKTSIDHHVLSDRTIKAIDNPIILSGGLKNEGMATIHSCALINSNFSGIAAGSSIFLQTGPGSALVSLLCHSNNN